MSTTINRSSHICLKTIIQKLLHQLKSVPGCETWKQPWITYLQNLTIKPGQIKEPQHLPSPPNHMGPAVPVSWFKFASFDHLLWDPNLTIEKTFLSSGTSQNQYGTKEYRTQSHSHFSRQGLFQYKIMSIVTFLTVLHQTPWNPLSFYGLSLIDPNDPQWHHSSLAQMIHWFCEFFDHQIIADPTDLEQILHNTPRPCWIFGTSSHWMRVQECSQIPYDIHQIYAFETGGLKAHTRTSTGYREQRQMVYNHIHHMIKLPMNHIGSEYSASELASQAWSFSPQQSCSTASYKNPYYFSPYIHLSTTTSSKRPSRDRDWVSSRKRSSDHQDHFMSEGELCLWDPLRCDFPHVMNTEDRIWLRSDGGFWPLSRSAHTSQKGCSLRVSEIALGDETDISPLIQRLCHPSDPQLLSPHHLIKAIQDLMRSPSWKKALVTEFIDESIAHQAHEDLMDAIQTTAPNFQAAISTSKQNSWIPLNPSSVVLIIAPYNHSLAVLYHLVFLSAAGCKMILRLPQKFHHHSCVALICQKLISLGAQIYITDESVQFGACSSLNKLDGVLVFGTDETLHQFKQWMSPHKLLGFGPRWGINLIASPTPDHLTKTYHDLTHLAGRGCMSSRWICLPAHCFTRKWWAYFRPIQTSIAHSLAYQHYDRLNQALRQPSQLIRSTDSSEICGLFMIYGLDEIDKPLFGADRLKTLTAQHPECPGVWGVLFYHDLNTMTKMIFADPNITTLASDQYTHRSYHHHMTTCPLGQMGRFPWDGTYEGRGMFQT